MKPHLLVVEDEVALVALLGYKPGAGGLPGHGRRRRRGGDPSRGRGAAGPHPARLDAAPGLGHRSLPPAPAQAGDEGHPDHHADGAGGGGRPGPWPGERRRRLRDQAVLGDGIDGAGAGGPAPFAAGPRGRGPVPRGHQHGSRPPPGAARRAPRSNWGRRNSACCATSSSIRAACSRASSCSMPPGAGTSMSRRVRWTSISGACARRSTPPATRTRSAPCARPATPWKAEPGV